MRSITVNLLGRARRTFHINAGESLANFAERNNSADYPLSAVQTWYCNDQPVSDPTTFTLQDGMSLRGAPKVEGGKR